MRELSFKQRILDHLTISYLEIVNEILLISKPHYYKVAFNKISKNISKTNIKKAHIYVSIM